MTYVCLLQILRLTLVTMREKRLERRSAVFSDVMETVWVHSFLADDKNNYRWRISLSLCWSRRFSRYKIRVHDETSVRLRSRISTISLPENRCQKRSLSIHWERRAIDLWLMCLAVKLIIICLSWIFVVLIRFFPVRRNETRERETKQLIMFS